MNKVLEVKVAKIDERARMPTKGSIHAAGWDLYALEDMTIPFRKSMKIINFGIHFGFNSIDLNYLYIFSLSGYNLSDLNN